MTEAAHQMTSNPLPPRHRKAGSVGVGTGIRISVMDKDANHLAANQRGEIVIQGASVFRGYENNAEANARALVNGWFRTGDEGYLDEDCYLQARVLLETRSNSYQVRTGRYDEEPISIYFTIRQYQQPGKLLDVRKSFDKQCEICEDLASRIVLPNIIRPIAAAIASAG